MEEQLAKFFAGESNQQEREEIIHWRNESSQNAQEFMDAKHAWINASAPEVPNESILKAILEDKPAARIVGWPTYLKYAAAVVLLAMIGTLWFVNREAPQDNQQDNQFVFKGSEMTLPDGTIVSLKEGSTLDVLQFSDDIRKVKITGKAFFEVVRDESRPFVVQTDDATVQVLGTSFQVHTTQDFTEVSVASGLVSFASNMILNEGITPVHLAKGEMGKVGKDIDGILKRGITDVNYLAWKNGLLKFDRATGIEIMTTLKDVYGADVSLDSDLLHCQLTAQFNQKSLEEVIQIISTTFNWTYKINKDKVVLSGKGC